MPDAKFILLGKPQILVHGDSLEFRSRKALGLLAYLALHERILSRQQLALILWPEASNNVAQTSLRNTLHEIRQTPLIHLMEIERYEIRLSEDVEVDVLLFQDYIKKIARLSRDSNLTIECITLMQQAAELYQDDFLANFSILGSAEFEDWQMLLRVDLQYEATILFARLAQYYAEQNIIRSAVRMANRWVELEPMNEEAHQLLMHLYAVSGQMERAVQQYHLLARQTKRDFDRLPTESVRTTYQEIKDGKYHSKTARIVIPKPIRSLFPVPPYHMLGRDQELRQLKAHLLNQASNVVVTLSGAPGIGKTILATALVNDADIQHQFSDAILWGSLNEPTLPEDILRLWLDAMRISVLKSAYRGEHLALQLRMGLQNKKVLLVIDNVRSAEELTLFRLGTAAVLLITPHIYGIGLQGASQLETAITLAPLSNSNCRQLLNTLAPDLLEKHVTQANQIVNHYRAYPAVIRAICYAYREYMELGEAKNAESFFDKLLTDRAILDMPSGGDGKRFFQQLDAYWKTIAPETQAHLKNLVGALDVNQPYLPADWAQAMDDLKLLLDYGLLIREGDVLYLHRLLWTYLASQGMGNDTN